MSPAGERTAESSAARLAVAVGAGSGLGRSLALRFAREGLHVALLARDADRLERLAAEMDDGGGTALPVPCDAGDPAALAEVVSGLRATAPIALLAYNAAAVGGELATSTLQQLRAAADVNLHSPVLAVQAALPDLQAHHGSVLLTGGGFALQPSGRFGVLSVGKAGLRATALALAQDPALDRVKVRTITVAGTIAPGTALDPDLITDTFWQVHLQPDSALETVLPESPQNLPVSFSASGTRVTP